MKGPIFRGLCPLLSLLMFLGPLPPALFAQADDDTVPAEQAAAVQQLAKKGYLGDKKDHYLSAKQLTDDDITDALLKADETLSLVDLKALKAGDKTWHAEDLKALLALIKDKAEDIRDRKVSAWRFERRVEKMIALLSPPASVSTPGPAPAPSPEAPKPTATATPVPGPSREEWDQLKSDLKNLNQKMADLQADYGKRIDALQKSGDDLRAGNADNREQLKLVKNLMDQVQSDLNKTNVQLDQVAQKANEKAETDTQLEQDLQVMRKDVRDNSQDVSILKQEVAKLDLSQQKSGQDPLDEILGSKWVAAGALVAGITALVISATKK